MTVLGERTLALGLALSKRPRKRFRAWAGYAMAYALGAITAFVAVIVIAS